MTMLDYEESASVSAAADKDKWSSEISKELEIKFASDYPHIWSEFNAEI